VDSECGIFQEKWKDEYFSVSVKRKSMCFVYRESTAVFKECNIARHYNSKHKETYKTCVVLSKEKKNGGLSHQRISSEYNPMIVPLHCGQVVVLATCWLKKTNIHPMGNS
jgi:hypothetical protein